MSDPLATGARISRALGVLPATYVIRAGSLDVTFRPFFLVQSDCKASSVYVIPGEEVLAELSAQLIIYYKRGLSTSVLYSGTISSWPIRSKTVLASPGTILQDEDILLLKVDPATDNPLPNLLVGVELELT